MKIEIYPPLSILEIGQRTNQEDAIAQWENHLFVLCDGMGGHEHGEVASQTVCQAIVNWCNVRALEPLSEAQVEDAIYYAYARLDEKDKGELRKMGTTLTLLYIGSTGVLAAHIGDSRIYHIRPKSSHTGEGQGEAVLYQSRDHSLVFDLFQAGEITYEEMATYPQKNIITRAMQPGADNHSRPDIIHITDIQPGDYFYMCSDGMLEDMTNEELVTLLSSHISDEEKRKRLIEATVNNQDNHTAWLIHVKDVVKEAGDEDFENEELTSRCNAMNIKQTTNAEPDVQLAESDDVVIVSSPPPPKKKPFSFIKAVAVGLLCIAVLAIAAILLFKDNNKGELRRPRPVMHKPIHREQSKSKTKDAIITDSNKQRNNESTRNQQSVNAPRRNDSTGHIPNR